MRTNMRALQFYNNSSQQFSRHKFCHPQSSCSSCSLPKSIFKRLLISPAPPSTPPLACNTRLLSSRLSEGDSINKRQTHRAIGELNDTTHAIMVGLLLSQWYLTWGSNRYRKAVDMLGVGCATSATQGLDTCRILGRMIWRKTLMFGSIIQLKCPFRV